MRAWGRWLLEFRCKNCWQTNSCHYRTDQFRPSNCDSLSNSLSQATLRHFKTQSCPTLRSDDFHFIFPKMDADISISVYYYHHCHHFFAGNFNTTVAFSYRCHQPRKTWTVLVNLHKAVGRKKRNNILHVTSTEDWAFSYPYHCVWTYLISDCFGTLMAQLVSVLEQLNGPKSFTNAVA